MNALPKITVLIKTMLRDAYLYDCIEGIRANLPEVRILVIDDGDNPAEDKKRRFSETLRQGGHFYYHMPFDSGFGAKSNMAVWHMNQPEFRTEYMLIGSDDFDFRPLHVRWGIQKMLTVLDNAPHISIASGTVNKSPYDFYFDDRGERVYEVRLNPESPLRPVETAGGVDYFPVDLTVNYSLIRSSILGFEEKQVHWDSDVKIGGGEHGAFFLDVVRAGHKVAAVPGVDIAEQPRKAVSTRYIGFRCRAKSPARPCFVRRGIIQYGSDYIAPGYTAVYG